MGEFFSGKGKIMTISRLSIIFVAILLLGCTSVPTGLSGPSPASDTPPDFSSQAVALSLDCVDQELPHAQEGQGNREHAAKKLHPAFFGCYDWHSAVHGHWAMLRLLDRYPELKERQAIIAKLNGHLTAKNIRRELNYLRKNPRFEFPYGDGWLLRLAEEVSRSKLPEARVWKLALEPIAKFVDERFQEYLPAQATPLRMGTHDSTAFALTHVWDYSQTAHNQALQDLVRVRAGKYFGADKDCGIASEPGSYDFISPCLVEADLMRRLLEPTAFEAWFSAFLPTIPESFLKPTIPKDPTNYSESHLIGLLFQKSSSMRAIAIRLPESDPRREQLLSAIPAHIEAGQKLIFESGYGGTHWIASFAIFYYTEAALKDAE
jgi:hypothetical protein